MPQFYHHIRYARPIYRRGVYRGLMTTLQNVMGFDTSDKAQFRFHVLVVFYKSGWQGVKLAFPKLKRATLYRWKKAYENSGKRLNSLLPKSTCPKNIRVMVVNPAIFELIKQLRQKYPRLGKVKIKLFVDVFCLKAGIETISSAKIGRIIKRSNLFYAGKGSSKRVRHNTKKERIRFCPKPEVTKPGYIQLDGLKFYYLGKYYYFLTAVDIVTKQAWVKLVKSLKSKHAAYFLGEILKGAYFSVHTLQTDNGSEFELYFEQAVQEANLVHLWNYPKHPKTTGFVERFNWTVQDEFLFSYEDRLLYPDDFTKELTTWLIWYNRERPHQSLGYMTPYQYAKKGGLSQKY